MAARGIFGPMSLVCFTSPECIRMFQWSLDRRREDLSAGFLPAPGCRWTVSPSVSLGHEGHVILAELCPKRMWFEQSCGLLAG